MVIKIIQIDNDKEVRQLIADEGKLLFLNYELEELGEEAKGVPEVVMVSISQIGRFFAIFQCGRY